jgi:hypothetical protein
LLPCFKHTARIGSDHLIVGVVAKARCGLADGALFELPIVAFDAGVGPLAASVRLGLFEMDLSSAVWRRTVVDRSPRSLGH